MPFRCGNVRFRCTLLGLFVRLLALALVEEGMGIWVAVGTSRFRWFLGGTRPVRRASGRSGHSPERDGDSPPGTTSFLDGVLDDEAWNAAVLISDFTQKVPVEGAEPSVATEVRMIYDDDALYIGARMYHPTPADIRTTLTRRDGESDAERLIIAFDSYHDRRTAYSFGVSAAGVRFDMYHPDDRTAARPSSTPCGRRVSRSTRRGGWRRCVSLQPASVQRRRSPGVGHGDHPLRARAQRGDPVGVDSRVAGPGRVRVAIRHAARISGIRPTRRIEILPYVAGGLTLESDVDAADPFDQKTRARVGADVKMGLGPNLTLDLTVNPDFGQVEADPAEVNLTAFETFFPERRPFFIEGNGMLDGPAFPMPGSSGTIRTRGVMPPRISASMGPSSSSRRTGTTTPV